MPGEADHHGMVLIGAAAGFAVIARLGRETDLIGADIMIIGLDRQLIVDGVADAGDALIARLQVAVAGDLHAVGADIVVVDIDAAGADADIGRELGAGEEVVIDIAHYRDGVDVAIGRTGAERVTDLAQVVLAPGNFAFDADRAERVAEFAAQGVARILLLAPAIAVGQTELGLGNEVDARFGAGIPAVGLRRCRRAETGDEAGSNNRGRNSHDGNPLNRFVGGFIAADLCDD